MWKIIGSAIGSFLASIFGSWWHDRKLVTAEDQTIEGEQAEHELLQETQTEKIHDEVQALPDSGARSADAELHAEFSRDR